MLSSFILTVIFTSLVCCTAGGVVEELHHIRSKRGLADYGNWCGAETTGKGLPCCTCDNTVDECRKCLKPKDSLDETCLRHDMCLCDKPPVGLVHMCYCEKQVYDAVGQDHICCEYGKWWQYFEKKHCLAYRKSMQLLFKAIPCWCDKKKELVLNFSKC
ncbi:uncharacterized protein LOC106181298 [Lingula anatina]|uniref:Uncharacterized protein LOC106158211 n=1 Tax=Lingula anatina TaxID=7574 RepID=A0A1S3HU66_LINAN|nr:uncharacterized protein LOC106158211 [Lingula anatina]XP_013389568.1 uncharacterized protein LOC106158211 [Lingula anatina]XP_013421084.1 uncharacterized protein LOC106181298 [Lingula anatina]|eukprot:XP_013389567.1 uncharacterized protein LOC106158211 [Lingula anatina]